MAISSAALAMLAAVTTATAIVAGLMLVSARRDVGIYKAQVRIANDTAEGAVRTAQRMQQALRVVSEEIMRAKADRVAADPRGCWRLAMALRASRARGKTC